MANMKPAVGVMIGAMIATMTDVTAGIVAVNGGGEFADDGDEFVDDGEALLMVVVTLGRIVPDEKMMMVDRLR